MVMRITIKLNYIKAKSEGQIHVEFYDLMALVFFFFFFCSAYNQRNCCSLCLEGKKGKDVKQLCFITNVKEQIPQLRTRTTFSMSICHVRIIADLLEERTIVETCFLLAFSISKILLLCWSFLSLLFSMSNPSLHY